jgi:hypothetical protein
VKFVAARIAFSASRMVLPRLFDRQPKLNRLALHFDDDLVDRARVSSGEICGRRMVCSYAVQAGARCISLPSAPGMPLPMI